MVHSPECKQLEKKAVKIKTNQFLTGVDRVDDLFPHINEAPAFTCRVKAIIID